MTDVQNSYIYEGEKDHPLYMLDLYNAFNSYRTWKFIMAILIEMEKTKLSEYKILEPGCGGGGKLRYLLNYRAKPYNCFGFDLVCR